MIIGFAESQKVYHLKKKRKERDPIFCFLRLSKILGHTLTMSNKKLSEMPQVMLFLGAKIMADSEALKKKKNSHKRAKSFR